MTPMAQDGRPPSLPHSLAALVLLLCVAPGTMAHLAAALAAAEARPGIPTLPGGLAAEMPLLAVASVLSPAGALVLDELLGMPLPDLVSPAVLMVSAAGLLLAGGGPARSAPPNRVARRIPGCQ